MLVKIISKRRNSERSAMDDLSFCYFKTIKPAEFIAV